MKGTTPPSNTKNRPEGREAAILKSVIREHILSGDPIGSRTVSRTRRLDISPATIRNVMAALEERGWLQQPHTSAGRLPTDRAYRWYVDQIVNVAKLPVGQTEQIQRALASNCGEIAELLSEASRQLSRYSNHVGLVLAPKLERILVEQIEFIRLEGRRVVAILVGRSGVVHNRILELTEPVEQRDLDRAGSYLSTEFHGQSLTDIREELHRRISEESATYDRLVAASLDLGRQAVETESAADLFVNGASNLLETPEFAEPGKLKSLIKALERKRNLVDLLSRVIEDGGVQVVIGEEQPSADLSDCSLVAASYGAGGQVMGTLGIVGPKRMEYARTIALVDCLAGVLGKFFSSSGIDASSSEDQIL